MGLFRQRRPHGFHHDYVYVNERKDRLKAVENKAKADLGRGEGRAVDADRIRGMFTGATKHTRRRLERKRTGGFVWSYGVILVLLVILVAIWKLLLSL